MKRFLNDALEDAIIKNDLEKSSYYIFDKTILLNELDLLKKFCFKNNIKISYSYKTNYVKPFIETLHNENIMSEVVSPFEVDLTKEFKINAKYVIYNGPVKSYESISYILKNGGLVNADSFDDLKFIINIAKQLEIKSSIRIGIRISLSKNKESRFGIEYSKDNFLKVKSILDKAGLNKISCIHIHYPDRDILNFESRIKEFFTICDEIKRNFGYKDFSIDIGGGLPSNMPYEIKSSLKNENIKELDQYFLLLDKYRRKFNLETNKFIIEPGTALAANCFHLVGNVYSINNKKSVSYVNTDISRTELGGVKNNVNYPIKVLNKDNKSLVTDNNEIYLSAYSCIEGDILSRKLKKGSILNHCSKIVLSSIGSYSLVFKSPFIRPDLPLYEWDGEKLYLKRKSQDVKNLIDLYY
tara:strand:+ start:982 stop:2217 length:1236 start_codon:yes stop_codon:yes gene_type:complete